MSDTIRLGSSEAKRVLDWHCALMGLGKASSGNPNALPRPRGRQRATWEFTRMHPRPTKERSIALLRGYIDLSGNDFPADGIRCADGRFLRPDLAVMKVMLHERNVRFHDGRFMLTDRGRRLIWETA